MILSRPGTCTDMTKKFLGTALIFWSGTSLILRHSPGIEQSNNRPLSGFKYLEIAGAFRISFLDPISEFTPPGSIQNPRTPWIPAVLGKCVTCWLRDDKLTIFFPFLKRHLPKFLGSATVMSHYWYFWKPPPHPCKESGVPLCWRSYPSAILIISFLLSMLPFLRCAIPQEKLQQLIC